MNITVIYRSRKVCHGMTLSTGYLYWQLKIAVVKLSWVQRVERRLLLL